MLLILFQVGAEPLIEQLSKILLVNAEEFKILVDSGKHDYNFMLAGNGGPEVAEVFMQNTVCLIDQ